MLVKNRLTDFEDLVKLDQNITATINFLQIMKRGYLEKLSLDKDIESHRKEMNDSYIRKIRISGDKEEG
jgi:hypothetical protein